jgi:hypothetical protein
MNCQDFRNTLPDFPRQDSEAAAHVGECAPCAALLDDERALAAGLRALAADRVRVKTPGRIEGRLLAEFRGQNGFVALPPARRWWVPVTSWLAAATLLTTAAFMLAVRGRAPGGSAAPDAAAELAGIDWAASLSLDEGAVTASDFIALPNAPGISPSEDVNLVRVEAPRSAMIAFGYPVPADRASEIVQVDVVLGSDGLARAIRFLDE